MDLSKSMAIPNRGESIIIIATVALCIGTAAICLRWYSRAVVVKKVGVDDWLMLVSYICFLVDYVLTCLIVHWGAGKHQSDLTVYEASQQLQVIYYIRILYPLGLGFTKLSILAFYFHLPLFGTTRLIIIASIILTLLITVIFSIALAISCSPPSTFWTLDVDGRPVENCMDRFALSYAAASISLITDLLVVSLGIKMSTSLKIPPRQKIGLVILFSLGLLVCGAAGGRISSIHAGFTTNDLSWETLRISSWTWIESILGVVIGSAPYYKPLFVKWMPASWRTVPNNRASNNRATNIGVPKHETNLPGLGIIVQPPNLLLHGDAISGVNEYKSGVNDFRASIGSSYVDQKV